MHTYINISGTSDFIQRIYILLTCVLLIGSTARNASGNRGRSVAESGEQMNIFVTDDTRYKPLVCVVALLWLAVILAYAKVPRGPPRASRQHPRPRVSAFFPLFGVRSVSTAVIVFTVGAVLEIVGKYLAALAISWIKARNPKTVFIPAQGTGHAIERTAAFFVLVCGEILLGTLLDSPAACRVLTGVQLFPTSFKLWTRLG